MGEASVARVERRFLWQPARGGADSATLRRGRLRGHASYLHVRAQVLQSEADNTAQSWVAGDAYEQVWVNDGHQWG
jgi:hypothetical protein